jgi:lipoprotein-releasing system permease protein
MPFELFLALRYLRARRRRALARTTALAAILGIATGVGALIVALALANGFHDEMRERILSGTAHLTILRHNGGPIHDWTNTKSRIKAIGGVTDVSASTYTGVLLTTPPGASEYAVVRGLDPDSRAADALRKLLTAGELEALLKPAPDCSVRIMQCAPVPALVGAELAQRLKLSLGDEIDLTGGPGGADPRGSGLNTERARIAGVFRTGLYEYDATWVYLPLRAATEHEDAVERGPSVLSVQVADLYATPRIAAAVRAELGPEFTTVDWQQANGPLFAALELERKSGAVIIGLIILIAALNITTTLILVVVERRVDIAVLGAMGARGSSIMLIFMLEGAFIGLAGAVLGVALGLAGCYLGQRFNVVGLPPDVYSISRVPFHPHFADIAIAAVVAFGLSLLSTIYPARAAARVRPAKALRDNA